MYHPNSKVVNKKYFLFLIILFLTPLFFLKVRDLLRKKSGSTLTGQIEEKKRFREKKVGGLQISPGTSESTWIGQPRPGIQVARLRKKSEV